MEDTFATADESLGGLKTNSQTTVEEYRGIVAEDRVDGESTILVIVPELTPGLGGGFGAAEKKTDLQFEGISESPVIGSATISNHIECVWMGSSNMKYPPYVRKGEQVTIKKYGDNPTYYWMCDGRDPELRRKEKWRVEISNVNDIKVVKGDNNTYFIEVDTLDTKTIRFQTSKSDGEAFKYGLCLDAKNSTAELTDDAGASNNRFFIDSKNTIVQANNKDGAAVILNKRNALLVAPDDVILKAGRQLVIDSPAITSQSVKGGATTVLRADALTIDAKDLVINGGTIGLNGPTKVSSMLVAQNVRSEGYSTGATGSAYAGSSIDYNSGSVSKSSNNPDMNSSGAGNRHCAAYENVLDMASNIVVAFRQIQNAIGVPVDFTLEQILSDARKSIMEKNKGT